jgi:hypothetical protein
VDSTDSRDKVPAGFAARLLLTLLPISMVVGGVTGYWASGADGWWLIWGGLAGLVIWFGWTLTLGLALAAGKDRR